MNLDTAYHAAFQQPTWMCCKTDLLEAGLCVFVVWPHSTSITQLMTFDSKCVLALLQAQAAQWTLKRWNQCAELVRVRSRARTSNILAPYCFANALQRCEPTWRFTALQVQLHGSS